MPQQSLLYNTINFAYMIFWCCHPDIPYPFNANDLLNLISSFFGTSIPSFHISRKYFTHVSNVHIYCLIQCHIRFYYRLHKTAVSIAELGAYLAYFAV